ncbi:competence/damage-inducible protein A [Ktedonospora formicarum]|uniref:CinA-like protein n=1 Tax=Ktedonospora formicarum TaxID=2778364 RepID=A0A8J3HSX6_9CHLR|nr:competence/damage-inducible protein A [Ktedonospora formicarum]GHO42666.1 putative competence-damage inducible protein [Ktedonospora formicarum]
MRAEIISCGTELLLGHITDTNATYLAQSLAGLGVDLFHVSQVGDNQERVVGTLSRAFERSDLIIMTGGLGPTEDDVTRESISALLGEEMRVDPVLEAELRARFKGREMPERNLKQATLIPSAQALPNPRGSAPGWFVHKDNTYLVAMPGVPHEMFRMWEEEAIPLLAAHLGGTIFTRLLRVSGLGESTVEERLQDLIHATNPTVATYAKQDAVDVRISAKATTAEEAERLISEVELKARGILGDHIFGIDKDTLASVTGSLLQARQQTLSVMESLTGGQLASTITDFKTSSSHFIGGVVSYSTDLKVQFGVPRETIERYGVVSEETAIAMAKAVCAQLGTNFGIGITGVAGPEELDGKPVGTMYIAVAGPNGVVTGMGPGWRASRSDNKRIAVNTALNLLRLYLEGRVRPK